MKKDEMRNYIQECLQTEEFAVQIYNQHLQSTLFLSGLSDAEKEKIQTVLRTLRNDSAKHERVFYVIEMDVEARQQDVF